MQLTTPIVIPHSKREITYHDQILLLGSCFSENMHIRFSDAYFRVNSNPFGVLYNPLSIARCISILLDEDSTQIPIRRHNGLYHSMLHHGDFSRADKSEFLSVIDKSIEDGRQALKEATVVIVTFGTAWVYELEGIIVGNCHKLPQQEFARRRLSVEETTQCWQRIIAHPALKDKHFIFTISPIRHLKDGLHQNQLSKSTLLLAVEQLTTNNPQTSYFPSYELLLDELRDYRFYADDMLHPSMLAVSYIWERFCATYFSKATLQEMRPLEQLARDLKHRPQHTDTPQYQQFATATAEKKRALKAKYPWI